MPPPENSLTVADRTLLAAQRAWTGDFDPRFWNCFEPGWRQSLRAGGDEVFRLSPEAARDRVRLEARAQARPDWDRIHPSWWLRALKDETPAVQRAVVAHAPEAIRGALQAGLGFSDEDLQGDGPAVPEALEAALALWAERLVGDRPDRDDPPVVRALTVLGVKDLTQLLAATGQVKWTLVAAPLSSEQGQSHAATLRLLAKTAFSALDPHLQTQAAADVAQFGQVKRDKLGSIGLVTFARLLEGVEPYRVRWALQHLPYSVAKLLRSLMTRGHATDPALALWESEILRFTWNHLRDEGRIGDAGGILT